MNALTMRQPHAVYRFYDHDGRLLYVGCAWDLHRRFDEHQRGSVWGVLADLGRTRVDWFDTRSEALAVEKAAIKSEDPIYNVAGRRGPSPVATARAADWDRLHQRERDRALADSGPRVAAAIDSALSLVLPGRAA